MPLMSDDNERSWSSGRDMITYRRTRLKSDPIEACQCLKSRYAELKTMFDDEDMIINQMDEPEATDDDDMGEYSTPN